MSSQQSAQCPICLTAKPDLLTVCNHRFCRRCLEQTLTRYNYCPLCRRYDPLSSSKQKQMPAISSLKQPSESEWNLQIARKIIFNDLGNGQEQVMLVNEQDGTLEQTNVYVTKGASVSASPGTNLYINGKKIDTKDGCQHQ